MSSFTHTPALVLAAVVAAVLPIAGCGNACADYCAAVNVADCPRFKDRYCEEDCHADIDQYVGCDDELEDVYACSGEQELICRDDGPALQQGACADEVGAFDECIGAT